ncbi:MAG: flagellar basal body-associated FliL family protein [Alphaproteobacteria bacterium]
MAEAEKKEEVSSADAPEENAEEEKGGGPLKLILFIGGPVVLVIVTVAVLYFMGVFGGDEAEAVPEAKAASEEVSDASGVSIDDVVTYDIPTQLINLSGKSKRQNNFLKLTVQIEAKIDEDNPPEEVKNRLDKLKVRIVDGMNTYLRELQVDDLEGSSGLQHLREELLDRINSVTNPVKIINVLFKEMLVQ